MSPPRILALVNILAVVLVLTASPLLVRWGETASAIGIARARAIHAVPGGPAVDIEIDHTRVFTDVAYKAITDYEVLPEGPHLVEVFIAGLPHIVPVFSTVVTVTAGSDYSVAANGTIGTITGTLFIDDNSPPTPGRARARCIHLSPNASQSTSASKVARLSSAGLATVRPAGTSRLTPAPIRSTCTCPGPSHPS